MVHFSSLQDEKTKKMVDQIPIVWNEKRLNPKSTQNNNKKTQKPAN